MIVIGCDPGMTGGFAKHDDCFGGSFTAQTEWEVEPMPVLQKPTGTGHMLDLPRIIALLEGWAEVDGVFQGEVVRRIVHVFLERAQSFPGEGVAHTFAYGRGFGQIEGILAAIPLRYTLVSSRTWTKAMHAGTEPGDPKRRSLIAARRLFPSVKLEVGRSTVPHKGVVDALLIAEAGRRSLAANPPG